MDAEAPGVAATATEAAAACHEEAQSVRHHFSDLSLSTAYSLVLPRFLEAEELKGDRPAKAHADDGKQIMPVQCPRGHNLSEYISQHSSQQQCDKCCCFIGKGSRYAACVRCTYELCIDCLRRRMTEDLDPVLRDMSQERLSELITSGRISCPANPHHRLQVRSCPEVHCGKCVGVVASPGVQCCECAEYVRCVQCLYEEIQVGMRNGTPVVDHCYQGIACTRHKCPTAVVYLSRDFEFDCLLCGRTFGHCDGPDVAVVCPVSRCPMVLCAACSDFVVFQRKHARKNKPCEMPDCTVELSVEVGRYPFWCSVCSEYFTPDDVGDPATPLVWLSDHKTCFATCLSCALKNIEERLPEESNREAHRDKPSFAMAARLLHGLEMLRAKVERAEYKKFEDFALKQELKWERGLQTQSILDAACIPKTPEAWHELEEMVHNSSEMPPPIVYEVEVAMAFRERLQELDPFILRLLVNCKWPLHTALRLITLSNAYAHEYDQAGVVWKAQSQYLREWSLEILNKLDKNEYIRNLVMNPRPSGIPRSLLHLALEAYHDDFLAHRFMHSVVLEKWNSPIRTDESFSTSKFILAQLLLFVISLVVRFINALSMNKLAKSLRSVRQRQAHPILALILVEREKGQWHMLDSFAISPKMTYQIYFLFFLGFLVAVSANTAAVAERKFTILQGFIFVWVTGMLVGEFTQAFRTGVTYFTSPWNLFDAVHISMYFAALTIKAIAASDTVGDSGVVTLLESYDCILSIAIISSYTRGLYMMLPSHSVGPLLLSFGRMLKNVAVFIVFAIIVIFAFTFSLAKIYNIEDAQRDVSGGTGEQKIAEKAGSFILFIKIIKTLGFGINNMPGLDPSPFMVGRYVVSVFFSLAFMTVTTIVLMNLLIAIMNDTFNAVEEDLEDLHKATLSDVVVEFSEISPVPAPLNLVTLLVPRVVNLLVWVARRVPFPACCCSCAPVFGCFHEVSPWSRQAEGSNFFYSAYMHTHHYMRAKRLNRALLAESALLRKLKPLLQQQIAADDQSPEDVANEKISALKSALEAAAARPSEKEKKSC
eukprot:m51a1_g1372 putative short transient receptor potential channel 4-like (1052) ;mRNA; r:424780-428546